MRWGAWAVLAAGLGTAAWGWTEPARGSAERRALMDALRPQAEALFGPPVEFVVDELRVAGDVAFAAVTAQRPGGGAIAIHETPGWRSGYFMEDAHWFGGQALLRRSGAGWVAVESVFGATDVWWVGPDTCAAFGAVIADHCR
ncbi:hypothetical protein [Rubellimicrobium sp. CFH 75288]|uniref:hypothetical protein n=1 Tax=Rubellimicrobium sp. CFH 75288 TaxID=2697034 RepID=UPI0014127206|nr:hypothetical protein [Rubellimicrobium sp. CFH 75288]NAZ36042.1 hypothetical protein [Rubellimicrobium sp. CFH 75288]